MLCFHNFIVWFNFNAIPNCNTRYSIMRNLCVPFNRICHTSQSIDYLGSVLWKFMSFEIKTVENPNTFKKLTKIHLVMRRNTA